MSQEELSVLNIDSFEDFEAGQSSSFKIEEGSYAAQCVGVTMVRREFEGKQRVVIRLLWQLSDGETTHTIRGNDWSISSSENAKFRQEVSKWFDKSDWGDVCGLLVKAGVIVKNEDGSARVNPDAFIGKKAKLLIANKKSKQGKDYPVVASMSPCKTKQSIPMDEVPWFMVQDKDILYVKLADGIQIRAKKEGEGNQVSDQPNPALAGEYGNTMGQFVNPKTNPPAKPQTTQAQFPTAGQNQMWPAPATPTAPNPTPAAPVVEDDDLPFN